MPSQRLGHTCRIPYATDLLRLHAHAPGRYPALIESAADDTRLGRFDILFACPRDCLRLDAGGALSGPAAADVGGFLEAFDEWWQRERIPPGDHDTLPFVGGWFVLLGYELANEVEPRLELAPDARQPVAVALRVPVAIVRDRETECAWIVAEEGSEADIARVQADIDGLQAAAPRARGALIDALAEPDPEHFLSAVRQVQDRIAAGDVYQCNLSREWTARLVDGVGAADVYAGLRAANPAPFAGLLTLPDMSVISSSPERLLRTDGRIVETRPIAGTRPRVAGDDDDDRRGELHGNPKERAEHVMLIDLERNDLGRICRPGSVEVDEFMVIETYAHVHHIVSNVRGRLRDGTTPGTIIRSVFPGGSITGCPKVRCMEIIRELEDRPRGAYTGAMGYINRDGSADLNILIRTIVLTGDEVSIAAGSGIVADSDPRRELDETRAKARGLLLALLGPEAA